MRNLFVALVVVVFLSGCAGQVPQANDIIGMGTDIGFYYALKNNPQYKAEAVTILNEIKVYANKEEITYNDLLVFAKAQFGANEDLTAIALIVGDDLFTDEPIINNIGLFDKYRAELIKRIDRLLFIASLVK